MFFYFTGENGRNSFVFSMIPLICTLLPDRIAIHFKNSIFYFGFYVYLKTWVRCIFSSCGFSYHLIQIKFSLFIFFTWNPDYCDHLFSLMFTYCHSSYWFFDWYLCRSYKLYFVLYSRGKTWTLTSNNLIFLFSILLSF